MAGLTSDEARLLRALNQFYGMASRIELAATCGLLPRRLKAATATLEEKGKILVVRLKYKPVAGPDWGGAMYYREKP